MWKTLAINLTEVQGLMCAIIVRRLREHKWTPEQIEKVAIKATTRCELSLSDENKLHSVASDAANMHARGTCKETIQQMAEAVFAVSAITIADDFNRSRVAEWN